MDAGNGLPASTVSRGGWSGRGRPGRRAEVERAAADGDAVDPTRAVDRQHLGEGDLADGAGAAAADDAVIPVRRRLDVVDVLGEEDDTRVSSWGLIPETRIAGPLVVRTSSMERSTSGVVHVACVGGAISALTSAAATPRKPMEASAAAATGSLKRWRKLMGVSFREAPARCRTSSSQPEWRPSVIGRTAASCAYARSLPRPTALRCVGGPRRQRRGVRSRRAW